MPAITRSGLSSNRWAVDDSWCEVPDSEWYAGASVSSIDDRLRDVVWIPRAGTCAQVAANLIRQPDQLSTVLLAQMVDSLGPCLRNRGQAVLPRET